MDGLKLLEEARASGLTVVADGDRLRIRGPRQAEPVVQRLIANKPLVMDALKAKTAPVCLPPEWHLLWDERAAIMEYEGGLPRERAEALALDDILSQMKSGNTGKNAIA